MAAIPLWHPRHGRKIATLEVEAIADEKRGWMRGDQPVAPVIQKVAPVVTPKPIDKRSKAYRQQVGRS